MVVNVFRNKYIPENVVVLVFVGVCVKYTISILQVYDVRLHMS